ncbi:MAG: MarR family transcriptional regulator [Alphaproteobacteria bacterium]|nr:MAG: MarR family transcriptional regulator [Alphaproteobacteria bacterium]
MPLPPLSATDALELWRQAAVETVRRDAPDLTARQLAVLLTVYLTPPPHTVRGLSALLKVAKPAITRAVTRLSILGLVRRKQDPADRRSVLVQRTVKGSIYLTEYGEIVSASAARFTVAEADSESFD